MHRLAATALVLTILSGCDYFVSAETRTQRAQGLISQGDYRGALVELKNALQKQPDLPAARLMLADVALWLGDSTSASAELQRVPATFDPARYADIGARIDLALGRPQPLLERLSQPDSSLPPARQSLYRGQALQALGQSAAAEREFRAASQADPGLVAAQVGIAETLAAQNDAAAAIAITAKLTEGHPDLALVWYSHGALLARRGDTKQAVLALQRARDLAPRQLEVLKQVAIVSTLVEAQVLERDIDAARSSSAALSKLVPGSPIALLMSSRVAMAANDYAAAVGDLRRAVNAAPRLVQARFMLGVALLAQGNLEQASQELNQVVQQAPDHIEARQVLAQVRMRLEDPDGALRVLVPTLQSGADDVRLISLIDAARSQVGASQTIAMLEQALQSDPDNLGLQQQLASAHLQAGDADKALELLRRGEGRSADARRTALLLQAIAKAQGTPAARAEVDAIVARNPADAHLLSLAAAFYARLGEADAARRLLNGALARRRDNPALLFTLAQIEWAAQRPDAAQQALQRLLRGDPKNPLARLALAELALARGDAAGATEHLEALRRDAPQAIEPRLRLTRLALAKDDAKTAQALVDELLKVAPGRADVLNAVGLLYLNSGRYDQAIGHFRGATKIDAGNPLMWLNLARAQLGLSQADAARQSLQEALKAHPSWVPAEGTLAFMDLQNGDSAAALSRVAALKQAKPKDASVLALEGELQMALRQYPLAAKAFEEAYVLQPAAGLAAKAYQANVAGQLPNAHRLLELWLQQHPDDMPSRGLLAEAYVRSADRKRAIEQYEAVLARQPRHVASLNNLAWIYYEQGDSRAVALARKASELAPNAAPVSDTLGWILVETGRVAEGLPILRQAVEQPGANGEIHYHYAAALLRAGAKDEGRTRLRRVLSEYASFPSRAAAEKALSELEREAVAGG